MRTRLLLLALLAALAVLALVALNAEAEPTISVTPTTGPADTPITVNGEGYTPGTEATVVWWTMKGNRVSGTGYKPVSWEMGTAPIGSDGKLRFTFNAPNDLGGVMPHNISVSIDGMTVAETPFVLERSLSITPTSGPEGTVIMFELESGGWTQYDNIVAITWDNSFIGYACSFTNQGHISVWFQAVGAVGTHIVGIYPSPWTGPSGWDPQSNPTPWKHPALNVDDIPTIYEPELFTFEITESTRTTRSQLGGATDLHEVLAGDSLAIVPSPAVPVDDGTPHLTVGNGGQGIVGGDIPFALAGFPANSHVVIRWDTRDGESTVGGEYNDKHLGWVFTEAYAILGEVDVDGEGQASGTLVIPEDYGGDHTIEAVVDEQVLSVAPFLLLQRFTATLSGAGTHVQIHATGLGWEKYTSAWDVLYDGKLMGWVTAMTTRGTADITIPVVGEPGLHTIEIHEGQNGFPFLNMHETSWPWTRVYRFAFTMEELQEPSNPGSESKGTSYSAVLMPMGVIAVALVATFVVLSALTRRTPGNGGQPTKHVSGKDASSPSKVVGDASGTR